MKSNDTQTVLAGANKIAAYIGCTRRQVYHWDECLGLPTFRIGRTMCAKPAAIDGWLARQEAASHQGGR